MNELRPMHRGQRAYGGETLRLPGERPKQTAKEKDMTGLAQWRCHKVVKAGRILEVTVVHGAGIKLLVEGIHGPVEQSVSADFAARSLPNAGDYFVIYEDGYMSHSPAKAFTAGYRRIEEE